MPFKKRVVVVEFIAVTSIYLISNVLTVKFCLTRCYTKSENNTFTRLKKDMGFWLLPCAKKFKTKIWHWLSNNLLLKIRTLEKSRIWIFPPKLAKIRNLTHLNLCVKISQNCNCRFLWKIGNQVFEFSRRNCNCRFFAEEKISISENHTLNVRAKIAFVDFCGKTLFFFLVKKKWDFLGHFSTLQKVSWKGDESLNNWKVVMGVFLAALLCNFEIHLQMMWNAKLFNI